MPMPLGRQGGHWRVKAPASGTRDGYLLKSAAIGDGGPGSPPVKHGYPELVPPYKTDLDRVGLIG